jgi:hypothetical protein
MKIIECSKETPWGIHPSLRDDQCPRCGWEAPKPSTPAVVTGEPPACSHQAAA